MQIDLNCDLGEGCGADAELMPLITSANISCGFHAGNVETAYQALQLAAKHQVAAGAHPGFDDPNHFGRRELDLPPGEVFRLCLFQVGALISLARHVGIPIRFIKPHGALYNMACREEHIARPVAAAAEFFQLPLVGLRKSHLEAACTSVPFIREGFADRRYQTDGNLVPRAQADAFIEDPAQAVEQARRLIERDGVQTLCVHGDNPRALAFVQQLRDGLLKQGFTLRANA